MNHIFEIIDLKLSAFFFALLTMFQLPDVDTCYKTVSFILFLVFYFRRFQLMEKKYKNNHKDEL